jgi:hypothetical protein
MKRTFRLTAVAHAPPNWILPAQQLRLCQAQVAKHLAQDSARKYNANHLANKTAGPVTPLALWRELALSAIMRKNGEPRFCVFSR